MQRSTAVLVGVALWSGGTFAMPRSASAQASKRDAAVLVYARDPLQTPEPERAQLPLPVQGQRLQHAWLTVHSCIDTGERGRDERTHVCSITASASPDAAGDFLARPLSADAPASAPDPFAEQMLFYHGARSLQFFAGLGLTPARGSQPLQLIANVRLQAAPGAPLVAFADATFLSASAPAGVFDAMPAHAGPVIYFGQDHALRVAYDAAAIRHEVSHAALAPWLPKRAWIVDPQGLSFAPAAISEGLADYFAAAIADQPRIGVHASQGARQRQMRDLDAALTCPAALTGAVHEDGLVLASALWAARKPLGAAVDVAIVRALRERPARTSLSSESLIQGVLAALARHHPKAARTASAIFRERGLTPSCQRVLELNPQQSLSGASGAFQLPGVDEALPLASSALQLRVAVPAGTSELELRTRTRVPAANAPASRFEPALLVKAGPIRWTPSGAHDASVIPAAEGGRAGELLFVVPASHAGMLYLQMVNRGADAGWFDTIRVALRRRP